MSVPRPGETPQQTVICMRWGTAFGVDYVNRLHRAVRRHTTRPTRFVVFCDDDAGLDPGIESRPIPPVQVAPGLRPGPWRKMALWSENLGGLSGAVLFLDLDVLVTGSLDAFFDYEPGTLALIRNWTQRSRGVGNTSVLRFEVGMAPHLLREFEEAGAALGDTYDNEQIFVTKRAGVPTAFWPAEWCRSFKHDLLPPLPARWFQPARLPADARIVVFTGEPRPHAASRGVWTAKWYKKFYKTTRPIPWVLDHWY